MRKSDYPYIPHDALRVLNKMFQTLEAEGWQVVEVDDGEEVESVASALEALRIIDSVEISTVTFKKGEATHGAVVIPSNEADVICDYSYSETDNFDALMTRLGED